MCVVIRMECTFCKKTFSAAHVLKLHQKATKYCLLIQKNLGIDVEKLVFTCECCNKEFSSKSGLDYHTNVCKTKPEEKRLVKKIEKIEKELSKNKTELNQYKLKIKELEDKLNERTTTNNTTNKTKNKNSHNTTNNHITIFQIMKPEHVSETFQKNYNLETLLGGQKALAQFLNDEFLSEHKVYACGDRSRQKFYVIDENKPVEDKNCEQLLGLTTPGLPHVKDVYETALFSKFPEHVSEDQIHDHYSDIMNLEKNNSEFKAELSKVVDNMNHESDPTPPPKADWKQMMRDYRNAMLPNESKLQREKANQAEDTEALVERPRIFGYSRGVLMSYRDAYQKDGTVKGPKAIMEEILRGNTELEHEYMEYLKTVF